VSIIEKPVLAETKVARPRVKSKIDHLESKTPKNIAHLLSGARQNVAQKPQNFSLEKKNVIDNWNISDVDMKGGEGAFEITGNRRYFSHTKAERATSATYSRLFKQRPVKMSQKDCDRLREEKELAKCTFSPKIKNLPKNFSNAS